MLCRKLRGNNLINCSQKTLTRFVKTIGFSFKTIGKRNVLMESETIQKWRRKYLEKIEEYRQQNRSFFYETWFDSHDSAKKGWTDNSRRCVVGIPPSKDQRIIILHMGGHPMILLIAHYI
jgi:hypothetical protein